MDSFNTNQPQLEPIKLSPEQLIRFGYGLGLVMVFVAFIWVDILRGQDVLTEWFSGESLIEIAAELMLGLVLGASFSVVIWYLGRYVSAFENIRNQFALVLDLVALRWWHVVALSVLAAVPEEVLFRGAVQPALGILITALIFGALHAITPSYFAYASFAGFALGYAFELTGALWLPIAAHFAVDYVSLMLLANWARQHAPVLKSISGPETLYGVADREDVLFE